MAELLISLVPYYGKSVIKNKKSEECIIVVNLKLPPDSERRETFESLMLKVLLRFLIFYTPQGGIELNDRLSRVRH